MDQMLQSTTSWVAISFCIFWALALLPLRRAVAAWLDGKIARVRQDVDAAASLRAEAAELLLDAQLRHKEAAAETADMMQLAQDEAIHIRLQADADLMAALKRREEQAVERIALAERQAMAELKQLTTRLAIDAARDLLANGLSAAEREKLSSSLIDKAAGDIGKSGTKAA